MEMHMNQMDELVQIPQCLEYNHNEGPLNRVKIFGYLKLNSGSIGDGQLVIIFHQIYRQ